VFSFVLAGVSFIPVKSRNSTQQLSHVESI
jgi:hypothetical protein